MGSEGFGDRVKKLREAKGLTQGDVERATGRTAGHGYLSNIEKGGRSKRPSGELIEALVSLTGASRAWLLEGAGPMFDAAPSAPPLKVAESRRRGARTYEPDAVSFASLEQYIVLAGDALDADVAAALRKEHSSHGTDPGLDYWKKRAADLVSEKRQIRLQLQRVGAALEEEYEAAGPRRLPPKG